MMPRVIFRLKSPCKISSRSVFPRKQAMVIMNLAHQCSASTSTATESETIHQMAQSVEDSRRTILTDGLIRVIQDRRRLLGCNVYITAGGNQQHLPLLTDLVQRAQRLFQEKSSKVTMEEFITEDNEMDRSLIQKSNNEHQNALGVLVHVFTDKVYNRTSLHFAGTPEIILDVATELIEHVVVELRKINMTEGGSSTYSTSNQHPTIGLVDHVAVVPLIAGKEARIVDPDPPFSQDFLTTHGANVARKLGTFIRETLNIHIFFYGLAHRNNLSLVKIRKRQTNFFKTDNRIVYGPNTKSDVPTTDSCTVGAPEEFVENYNVRLKETCSKKTAQHLSRLIRESDGGLPGIEAMALQYSKNRWEVACNILRPLADDGTNIDVLKEEFREWNESRQLVERGYRVGTTQKQSIKALESIYQSEENRKVYDQKVMTQFQSYLKIEE